MRVIISYRCSILQSFSAEPSSGVTSNVRTLHSTQYKYNILKTLGTSNLEVTPEEAWKFQVSSICCILSAMYALSTNVVPIWPNP